jgi:V-type H+-transporting ATPase subunit a
MDPTWYNATNELAVFNSLKMKLAVIIGVTQMMFGITMKGANCIFFKDYLGLFFEFIP